MLVTVECRVEVAKVPRLALEPIPLPEAEGVNSEVKTLRAPDRGVVEDAGADPLDSAGTTSLEAAELGAAGAGEPGVSLPADAGGLGAPDAEVAAGVEGMIGKPWLS